MASGQSKLPDFPDIADVYERFAALTEQSPELGGSLLLYTGLDGSGIALAIAANVAGAASLGLEADLARAKASIRNGACDFLVNTLDEALRILKNEIRKKKPVAVVLVGEPPGMVAEMVGRGVQPEIVAGEVPGMETLVARGARRLDRGAVSGEGVSWSVEREPLRWLPMVDRLAAEVLDPADKTTAARRRWLEAAPRYLGRALAGQRYLRMSAAEADRFAEALHKGGGVDVAVTVSRRSGSQTRVP
jgi:Urocanase Rossmann-like domain